MTSRRRRLLATTFLLGLLAGCGNPPRPPDPRVTQPPRLATTFDLEARGGGAALATENTLAAFGRALEVGVTTLELSVQLTEDGQVVVAGGPRLRDACPTAPQADRRFAELTLTEVQALDCQRVRAPGFPEQRVADERVPSLREAIALLRQRAAADVGLAITLGGEAGGPSPAPLAEAVWTEVETTGMTGRVTLASPDWAGLAAVHAAVPRARLVARTSAATTLTARDLVAAATKLSGVVALSPDVDLVDMSLVTQAHAAGLLVLPMTVDDAPTMKYLIELGVDGIVTNRPDVLRTVMSDEDLPMPEAHPGAS